jgi:hypothetical protein
MTVSIEDIKEDLEKSGIPYIELEGQILDPDIVYRKKGYK